jgi:undecaprenyl-phosphate 4-deoxy-4-formamido-L-arabinose transferase
MSRKSLDFSVVVPVHNSEDSLKELFLGIKACFEKLDRSYEVIFVNDYSRDKSWKVLEELHLAYPDEVRAISLSRNFGQHNAIFCGFTFVQGMQVITMDDDLQNPPEEIPKLIEEAEKHESDLVYGIPAKKSHSRSRRIGSKALHKSSHALYDGPGNGSSFRLINRGLVDQLLNHHHNFIYLDELLNWYTRSISFVNVEHRPRPYQQSGYSKRSLFRLFANIVLFYTNFPLRLIVYGGFLFSLISFIIGIFFIYRKVVYEVPLGFTAQIVAIFFSTGLILLSLGVIGEYLSRIYALQQKKPPFSIKKAL